MDHKQNDYQIMTGRFPAYSTTCLESWSTSNRKSYWFRIKVIIKNNLRSGDGFLSINSNRFVNILRINWCRMEASLVITISACMCIYLCGYESTFMFSSVSSLTLKSMINSNYWLSRKLRLPVKNLQKNILYMKFVFIKVSSRRLVFITKRKGSPNRKMISHFIPYQLGEQSSVISKLKIRMSELTFLSRA